MLHNKSISDKYYTNLSLANDVIADGTVGNRLFVKSNSLSIESTFITPVTDHTFTSRIAHDTMSCTNMSFPSTEKSAGRSVNLFTASFKNLSSASTGQRETPLTQTQAIGLYQRKRHVRQRLQSRNAARQRPRQLVRAQVQIAAVARSIARQQLHRNVLRIP